MPLPLALSSGLLSSGLLWPRSGIAAACACTAPLYNLARMAGWKRGHYLRRADGR